MNGIDLAFTRDSDWLRSRKEAWKIRRASLSNDFSDGDLDVIEHFFFTGETMQGYKISQRSLFYYYPRQDAVGWDYALENFDINHEGFKDIVLLCFQDFSLDPVWSGKELDLWDYFFDEVYNTVVKSRVPVGENQEVSEVELDPVKVFCLISSGIMGAIERGSGGDNPKWFERSSYYWSLFPMLKDCFFEAERRSPEAKSIRYISRLFATTHIHDQKIPYVDSNGARSDFIKEMEEEVEGMYSSLCSGIQKLWDEAKSQKKLENN